MPPSPREVQQWHLDSSSSENLLHKDAFIFRKPSPYVRAVPRIPTFRHDVKITNNASVCLFGTDMSHACDVRTQRA